MKNVTIRNVRPGLLHLPTTVSHPHWFFSACVFPHTCLHTFSVVPRKHYTKWLTLTNVKAVATAHLDNCTDDCNINDGKYQANVHDWK